MSGGSKGLKERTPNIRRYDRFHTIMKSISGKFLCFRSYKA